MRLKKKIKTKNKRTNQKKKKLNKVLALELLCRIWKELHESSPIIRKVAAIQDIPHINKRFSKKSIAKALQIKQVKH